MLKISCMELPTPKKLHPRNSVCRLCGGAYESRHMLWVLGKSGVEKNLPAKIHHVCGITVSEADCLPKLVCRKCKAFLSKVSDFKQTTKVRLVKIHCSSNLQTKSACQSFVYLAHARNAGVWNWAGRG